MLKNTLGKICSIYHQSNKNEVKLETVAKEFEIEIIKSDQVLWLKWATCSLQNATSVYQLYPSFYKNIYMHHIYLCIYMIIYVMHIYMHFTHSFYFGLSKGLANITFLQGFALVINILEEFLFPVALQSRCTSM